MLASLPFKILTVSIEKEDITLFIHIRTKDPSYFCLWSLKHFCNQNSNLWFNNALQMTEGEQMVAGSNSSYDCRCGRYNWTAAGAKQISAGRARLLNLFFSIPRTSGKGDKIQTPFSIHCHSEGF